MTTQEKIEKLEERQKAIKLEQKENEKKLEALKEELQKENVEAWAAEHGLTYEQLQAIPLTDDLRKYISKHGYHTRDFFGGNHIGEFCQAYDAYHTQVWHRDGNDISESEEFCLVCRYENSYTNETPSIVIPNRLIIEAFRGVIV